MPEARMAARSRAVMARSSPGDCIDVRLLKLLKRCRRKIQNEQKSATKRRGEGWRMRPEGVLGVGGPGRTNDAEVVATVTVKEAGAPLVMETLAGAVQVATKGTPVQVKVSVPVKLGLAEATRLNCAG